jgi:leucyl-tRNA---protein transferase
MEYDFILDCNAEELQHKFDTGWRRFGMSFFRPICESCIECKSLRVVLNQFEMNRRALSNNQDIVIRRGLPFVTEEKLRLYDRFHQFQEGHRGWNRHEPKDARSYRMSFVEGPMPPEEWCYFLDDRLVAVGYVDVAPQGLSAIYFYYDPDLRERSLGTFNVLKILEESARRNMPYAYLGYMVDGCISIRYKQNFRPNEYLTREGVWIPLTD